MIGNAVLDDLPTAGDKALQLSKEVLWKSEEGSALQACTCDASLHYALQSFESAAPLDAAKRVEELSDIGLIVSRFSCLRSLVDEALLNALPKLSSSVNCAEKAMSIFYLQKDNPALQERAGHLVLDALQTLPPESSVLGQTALHVVNSVFFHADNAPELRERAILLMEEQLASLPEEDYCYPRHNVAQYRERHPAPPLAASWQTHVAASHGNSLVIEPR